MLTYENIAAISNDISKELSKQIIFHFTKGSDNDENDFYTPELVKELQTRED